MDQTESPTPPLSAEDIDRIGASSLFDPEWYVATYPDAALYPGTPLEHFARFGTACDRDPGPRFSAAFYGATHADARRSPSKFLHYLRHGQAAQRYRNAEQAERALVAAARAAERAAYKIFVTGFETEAVREADALLRGQDNPFLRHALARTLAIWAVWRATRGEETDQALLDRALGWLDGVGATGLSREESAALDLLRMRALIARGQEAAARFHVERVAAEGRGTVDLRLALTLAEPTIEARHALLDAAYRDWGLQPPALAARGATGFARLSFDPAPVTEANGIDVTVVVAGDANTKAAEILRTVRSVQASNWPVATIVVACPKSRMPKPEDGARFDVLPLETGKATLAEALNLGRRAARGRFVTAIEVGDLMHPGRLRAQAMALAAAPDALAVTVPALWLTEDLQARAWCGPGGLGMVRRDAGSAMVRRAEAEARLGDRDTVPGGAEEYLARAVRLSGEGAVIALGTGPLTLLRDDGRREAPAVQGPLPRGAALDYLEAQAQHHAGTGDAAGALAYDMTRGRPFPAPVRLTGQGRAHYDVIIASDFRLLGGSTLSNASELRAQRHAGLKTGLFQMYRYDFYQDPWRPMLPEIRREVDGDAVQVLTEGDAASCDLLILRYPPILRYRQTIVPRIDAKAVKVIVNQPPMSDYSEDRVLRYTLAEADRNARAQFGVAPVWHPIGPLVRDAMLAHHAGEATGIDLSADDWFNIIDVAGWARPPRVPRRGMVPRIGRHSRDHAHKWPDTAAAIRAAYPDDPAFEVRILGGASPVRELLGAVPERWTVHDFGAMSPRDFLAGLDFWVYFSHPSWVESFGRTIIEAMAVGMPVLLSETYRPLFGEHAIYCTPDEVQGIVRRLWADPEAYRAHVEKAQAFVAETFSFRTHIDRLQAAGVRIPPRAAPPPAPREARLAHFSRVRGGIKDSAETLADLPQAHYDGPRSLRSAPAIYDTTRDGHRFDFLLSPREGADRLFVFFSGDAMRSKYNPPVFQRWKWAPMMPGHCLYVSDPTLAISDTLGLSWYCGTEHWDPQARIAEIVGEVASRLGVTADRIVTYGSSGGGFASLRILPALPQASAITINPQTDVTRYKFKNVEKYIDLAAGTRDRAEALRRMPRLSLYSIVDELRDRRIAYLQNTLDDHHYEAHYQPFRAALAEDGAAPRFAAIEFSAEGGHGAAETPEAINNALDLVCGE